MSIRERVLPSHRTYIRDIGSGLVALANTDGTYRAGVYQVWEAWATIKRASAR